MSDRSDLLAQFAAITGVEGEQAQFYLESAKWDLQAAISSFFEGHGGTFQELLAGGGSDESDADEGENYFAGGEKSGVMMQGGPKDNKGGALDLVKGILDKAAKTGPPPDDEDSGKAKKPSYFGGSGYRLGSEDDAGAGPSQPVVSAPQPTEDPSTQRVDRQLTFWRDGFSIDDGPLLRYDDPANQEFLKAINSGRAPTSLLNVAYGQPVEVKVAHRMQENYKPPPKKPAPAFSGTGNRLGGVVPGESAAAAAAASMPMPGTFPGTATQVSVDHNLPSTSIQIRLSDGTRMVAKFNHSHTVADLYNFVRASRPDTQAFVMQTTLPMRELKDMNLTLKDAGLLNSVVVQRLA
nr:hypothetical protein HK105_005098 [Polyrhizophydium stewartii]